jgi:hypothetical protein
VALNDRDDQGLLIFAKDVTIWDSLFLGHWWSPTTGPGPKLLRFINEIVKGEWIGAELKSWGCFAHTNTL